MPVELDADGVWIEALARAKEDETLAPSRGVLMNSAGIELAGTVLRVAANEFARNFVLTRPEQHVKLSGYVSEVLGRDCEVVLVNDDVQAMEIVSRRPKPDLSADRAEQPLPVPQVIPLSSKYLPEPMGKFIVQDRNRVPYGMGMVLLGDNTPARRIRFIGPPASGKTHLAFELCRIWEESHPGEVVYIPGWKYRGMFYEAARCGSFSVFNDLNFAISNASFVVLDDAHVLFEKDGKVQTQIEGTYNFMAPSARLLLVTTRPLSKWKITSGDFASRLGGSSEVAFPEPDLDLRLAIAQARARELHLVLDPELLALVANRNDLDLRWIDGLIRELAMQQLAGAAPTLESANAFLLGNDRPALNPTDTYEQVVRTVIQVVTRASSEEEVTEHLEALKSGARYQKVSRLRHLAVYTLCRISPRISHESAMDFFGRERTTGVHSIQEVERFMGDSRKWPELPEQVAEIKRRLKPSSAS